MRRHDRVALDSRDILAGKTYPYLPFVDDVQVVFDVGANCGATTVHFARHYPDAQVHSFEPGSDARVPRAQRGALRERARAPDRALLGRPGGAALQGRRRHRIRFGVPPIGEPRRERARVAARRGPWAAEHGIDRIDILKVDVEGAEVEVVTSLADLLPTVKVLYVEYDSRQSRRDIEAMLDATHELYTGMLFLDQGECIYLRKDLADLDAATEFWTSIRLRWTGRGRRAARQLGRPGQLRSPWCPGAGGHVRRRFSTPRTGH